MADPPIYYVNDLPSVEGVEFEFEEIIQTLQMFISSVREEEPLNICVSGVWGTGKTTLLKGLEKAFTPDEEEDGDEAAPSGEGPPETRYVTVWFDPWKLGSEEEIRNALARAVLEKIETDSTFATQLEIGIERKNVLRVLSDRLLRVNPDDVNAFYKAESKTRDTFVEVEDIFRRLAEVYLEDPDQRRRMVIFVDDLDRCKPDQVTGVLEAVKLFFDLPGLIFVFALDTAKVEQAVGKSYKLNAKESKTYLEKIFQLTVPLPGKGTEELRDYVKSTLSEIGVFLDSEGLLTAIIERYGHNLRNLKRFINYFSYRRLFIGDIGNLDEEALFRWLYLESTMGRAITAASGGPEDLVLALEFIAHGGFLHEPSTRDRYLKKLEGGEMNFVALIAYAVVSKHDDVEFPTTALTTDQRDMVAALQASEEILPTLRVLREGSKLLIDSDLQQIIGKTRGEDGVSQPSDPSPTGAEEKKTGFLRWGNPYSAQEWNILGDRLVEKAHVAEAYLSYMLAPIMEPGVAMFIADVAKPFRRTRQYEATRELLARAFEMDPTSYVLGEVAVFYDVTLKEEDIGSTMYRKAILHGNSDSGIRFNLALNLHKQEAFEKAFLSCLDAWIRDPENELKKERLMRFAQDAKLSEEEMQKAFEEPRNVLTAAVVAGEYPFPVTDEEERKIQEHVLARPDPDTAASQLSRPL